MSRLFRDIKLRERERQLALGTSWYHRYDVGNALLQGRIRTGSATINPIELARIGSEK
jgi:hypothetical protein